MGIFIDVNEKLSEKVIEDLIITIKTAREHEERSVQKVCKNCIHYLTSREANYELAEKNIEQLNKISVNLNPFHWLLLGVLYESLDEDEQAIKYFTDILKTSITSNFREELTDLITIGKFYTLSDFSEFEQAGLILITKFSDESDISDLLWQLFSKVNQGEYISTFENFCTKALELYPDSIGILYFNGFIKKLGLNYQAALELFILVKDVLEKDVENPEYNLRLANIWLEISNCYLKNSNPDKTIEACDIALQYDQKSEDLQVGPFILNNKAEALLSKGEKESALAIIDHVLEENPKNVEAAAILEKIKADQMN